MHVVHWSIASVTLQMTVLKRRYCIPLWLASLGIDSRRTLVTLPDAISTVLSDAIGVQNM